MSVFRIAGWASFRHCTGVPDCRPGPFGQLSSNELLDPVLAAVETDRLRWGRQGWLEEEGAVVQAAGRGRLVWRRVGPRGD